LSKHPQFQIHIGENSEFFIEGIVFSPEQVSVLLKILKRTSPKAILYVTIENRVALKHLRSFRKIASKFDFNNFIIKIEPLKIKQKNKPE